MKVLLGVGACNGAVNAAVSTRFAQRSFTLSLAPAVAVVFGGGRFGSQTMEHFMAGAEDPEGVRVQPVALEVWARRFQRYPAS